jgi:hypothetical protein
VAESTKAIGHIIGHVVIEKEFHIASPSAIWRATSTSISPR